MDHFYNSIELRSSEDEAFPTALPSSRQHKPPLPPPKIRRRSAIRRKIRRPHSYACGSTGCDSIKPRIQPRQSLEILPKPSPIEVLSSPMSIQELVEEHQKDFPIKVEVNSGMYGETDMHTFSASDRLNIHFIKKVKMAVIEHYGGKVVKVPLNSDLQLGVLYDPHDDIKAALNGYEYMTAGDLRANTQLPKVVCAQQTYKGSSSNSSVDKGDILAVSEVQPSGVFGGGNSLNCALLNMKKMQTSNKKKLSKRCSGFFTTKPANLKLFLPEIVHYYELPVKAVVFITNHSYRNSPFTDGEVVTITKVVNELTVLATSVLEEGSAMTFESPMFDIPVDTQFMDVKVISSQEYDCEILYEKTRTLFENYKTMDKSKTIQIQEESDSYYTALLTEDDSGVELVCPESIYMKLEPKSVTLEDQMKSTIKEINELTQSVASLKTEIKDLVTKHDTSADVPSIKESPHVPTTPPAGTVGQSEQELNKERVRSLSCSEVLTLLERLNMSAYKEVFEEEWIDGQILLECDEEILSTELKVTSRLHRIKLKKIISGKQSVQELLEERTKL